MTQRRAAIHGFTLVEMLITIVVIAILAAIAYPSYSAHLRKSRRAEAQQVLMDAALRQQQILLDTKAYAADLAGAGVTVPASVTPHYTISVTRGTGTAAEFTATAAPQGPQAQDTCGTLTVNQANVRTPGNCW